MHSAKEPCIFAGPNIWEPLEWELCNTLQNSATHNTLQHTANCTTLHYWIRILCLNPEIIPDIVLTHNTRSMRVFFGAKYLNPSAVYLNFKFYCCVLQRGRTLSPKIFQILRHKFEFWRHVFDFCSFLQCAAEKKHSERWGAGVETQKIVRGEIGGWGRVPFNEPYAPLLNTIYDGA